ncbi:sugar phosphate nucleotidyltransferase [Chloroflexota bacterium]
MVDKMQAVILAGGLGTRLRPLTDRVPKVMVSVGGRPFLLHLIELLKRQGVDDIILCIGYLGHYIKEFFSSGKGFGIRIRYSEEKRSLLGTAGALKQAESLLDNHFLVINGDTYLPIDYRPAEAFFLKQNIKAVMIVYDNKDDTGVKNNVELDNSMVTRYDKESADSSLRYVETGALIIKREALALIQGEHPISLETGLYPSLIRQKELIAYVTQQRFYDMGRPDQLKVFEEFASGGTK